MNLQSFSNAELFANLNGFDKNDIFVGEKSFFNPKQVLVKEKNSSVS
jgi:hypothetical protein